jgi:hypothetical protein
MLGIILWISAPIRAGSGKRPAWTMEDDALKLAIEELMPATLHVAVEVIGNAHDIRALFDGG